MCHPFISLIVPLLRLRLLASCTARMNRERLRKSMAGLTYLLLVWLLAMLDAGSPGLCASLGEGIEHARESELQRLGIEPNHESVREYLESLHPDDAATRNLESLVIRLGSNEYGVREDATRRLMMSPVLPIERLMVASRSPDPEIAFRASTILRDGRSGFEATLFSVMDLIARKEITGLIEEVLKAVPFIEKEQQLKTVRLAAVATARPDDAKVLTRYLASSNDTVRSLSMHTIAKRFGAKFVDLYASTIADPSMSDRVKFEAALALADLGDRRCLDALIDLMQCDEVSLRVQSSIVLRKVTGQSFGFAGYDKPQPRQASIDRWKGWIASQGAKLQLNFPIDQIASQRVPLHGHTLLALGYLNQVVELDADGKELWSTAVAGAWMAERLANGNTLVAAYNDNAIVELDPQGAAIWRLDAASVLSVKPLNNGNLLAALHVSKQVHELTRDGDVVWSFQASGNCCDAHRLQNGNTLICAGDEVIEVTPDKEIVWKYEGNQIYGVCPLDNDNLLACELTGRVVEVSRENKEIIWEYGCENPVDAYRLENGNTLITSAKRIIEVSPDKSIVWTREGANYGSARK